MTQFVDSSNRCLALRWVLQCIYSQQYVYMLIILCVHDQILKCLLRILREPISTLFHLRWEGAHPPLTPTPYGRLCQPQLPSGSWCTVEPRLRDTPVMRTSMIMRTLCLVRNTSIDLHTIRTPEMQPPRYSVKQTLHMAPTVSLPMQTHPHSGHFAK